MECCCYLRNVQDLLQDGKTPSERRFVEPFNGPTIPFGAMVGYDPISARDQSRLHQFGKKVLPGKFLGYAFEELEKIDASEIHVRRLNAKEALTPQKGGNFIFPVADGTAKMLGRDHEFRESALRQEQLAKSEDLSGELQGEPEGVQQTESRNNTKARKDCRSIQGDFIYRHHNEPRVQLCVPKEETFPIPLKHIDVARSTHTHLDV